MVGGIVGLYRIGALFSPRPGVIAVQAAAAALFLWARWTFGMRSFHPAANPTEGGVVTSGPYRWLRHPIYAAILLFAAAGAAARPSLPAAGFAALLLAGALIRALAEERLLVERYPEYANYALRTRRFVPFVF
jgi:protein-S-isoprenylcysteine O-methyltransferase Ste14